MPGENALDGPPHAIYLDPRKPKADGAPPGGVVLNRGKGLRPQEDARGWRWRGEAAGQMDGSLIAEGRVARMEAE